MRWLLILSMLSLCTHAIIQCNKQRKFDPIKPPTFITKESPLKCRDEVASSSSSSRHQREPFFLPIMALLSALLMSAHTMVLPNSFFAPITSSSSAEFPPISSYPSSSSSFSSTSEEMTSANSVARHVSNHLIKYGNYCGPGPENPFNAPDPIDAIDRVCQGHDQRYRICLTQFQLPSFTSQAMAVRGLLPSPFAHLLPRDFHTCIHEADAFFVTSMKQAPVPIYWDHPSLAPQNMEGTKGYSSACAVGLSNGFCVLSSKMVFSDIAISLFNADLQVDSYDFPF